MNLPIENTNLIETARRELKANKFQPLQIPDGWQVKWNHFLTVNPQLLTNDAPEWIHFSEDIAFFMWGEYTIELGWYGGMNLNGFYEVTLNKENERIESFCSRDIEKVTSVFNYFFIVPLNKPS